MQKESRPCAHEKKNPSDMITNILPVTSLSWMGGKSFSPEPHVERAVIEVLDLLGRHGLLGTVHSPVLSLSSASGHWHCMSCQTQAEEKVRGSGSKAGVWTRCSVRDTPCQ